MLDVRRWREYGHPCGQVYLFVRWRRWTLLRIPVPTVRLKRG